MRSSRRSVSLVPVLLTIAFSAACSRPAGDLEAPEERRTPATSAATVMGGRAAPPARRVQTVEVPVPDDLPAFVVRGGRADGARMLFVPGMCVHPAGYAMSFQHTAASRGQLVAVQGDVSCGGDGAFRRWSSDLEAMDRRIVAAFHAAGLGEPRGVIVIGYSQGAERAEKLVARFPERYSAAVLMSSPVTPSPARLARAGAVALMAGTLEAQGAMSGAVGPLRRAGVPAAYFPIPGARHGQMGEHPEETMREALDFVEESLSSKSDASDANDAAPKNERGPA